MEKKQQKKGKILSFQQDTDFFLRRGAKELDRNDLLSAVQSYRKAYTGDPTDLDSCLALADVLNRMGRFEESNRLLLVDISMNDPDPESYFGIANNFYRLSEFDLARENLEMYLHLEPDGYYAYDAAEFLDVLADEEALLQSVDAPEQETAETLTVAARARRVAAHGDFSHAQELLELALAKAPRSPLLTTTLAAVSFFEGDVARALELTERMLAATPARLAPYCNRLLFLLALRGNEAVAEAGAALDALDPSAQEDEDGLAALSLLQIGLGRHADAARTLQKLIQFQPYDPLALHRLGYCRYLLGDADGARACYRRLLTIDPDDTVAQYYSNACRRRYNAHTHARYWGVEYLVPQGEALRRFQQINALFAESEDVFASRWHEDRAARNLVVWALTLPGQRNKSALLRRIAAIGDADAERVLRDYLLRPEQPDAARREAMALLQHMGAKEPYHVFWNDRWIKGYVDVKLRPQKLPAAYQGLLNRMEAGLLEACTPDAIFEALCILRRYLVACDGKFPRISTNQQASFAAALELLGRQNAGETPDQAEIARRYRVSLLRLHNAVNKFAPFVKEP